LPDRGCLIEVAVVTGFAIDPDVVVKMLCVGIIVGPLVDTLIVRMVQVPAATAGLGGVSWWTPKRWAVGTSLTAGRNGAHR
jgi:RND superfamily putative drug exporter